MLQQVATPHKVGCAEGKLPNPVEILVLQAREKCSHIRFDHAPSIYHRSDRGIIRGDQRRPTWRSPAAFEPAPLRADHVDHRVAHRSKATGDLSREFVRREL